MTFSSVANTDVDDKISPLSVDTLPEYDDHESVLFFKDSDAGVRGFIAIHNTNRGPAVGGTRYWNYKNDQEALRDVLRLSRAMTYKCALADLPYGGAKAVLIATPGIAKDEAYLASYARRLNALSGTFYTGEDVGLGEEDIRILQKHSHSIIGRPDIGELPSYWAACSVFYSMQAALSEVFGTDSFAGRIVAVKGIGNVGLDLCKMIAKAGGKIIVADVNPERLRLVQELLPDIRVCQPDMIVHQEADIYAPCALGSEFTESAIPTLAAKIICGAANNQLMTHSAGVEMHSRGILYIPDYIANSGGLINVADELHESGYSRARVAQSVKGVRKTVEELIQMSKSRGLPTIDIAEKIGRDRISK